MPCLPCWLRTLSGQLDDQPADLKRRWSAAHFCRLNLPLLAGHPYPAAERIGMNDRDQLVERPAQFGTEPDQPVSLLRSDRNAPRELAAENLILDLQVGDLAGQLFARGAGDQQQESVVDVPHGRSRLKWLCNMGLT